MSTPPVDPAAYPIGAPAGWRADPARPGLERFWDGAHWTDEVRSMPVDSQSPDSPAIPGAAAPPNPRAGSRALALVVQSLLVLCSLLGAVLAIDTLVVFNALSVWRLQPTAEAAQEVQTLVGWSVVGGLVAIGLNTVTGVLFLIWLGVRYTDSRLAPGVLRRSTGMAILCWFLPIVSLWWPAQVVKDLWHASRPQARRLGPTTRLPLPPVFLVWWPAWLFSGPGSVVVMESLTEPNVDPSQLGLTTVVTGVQEVATIIAAWALIAIIAQIEDHLVEPEDRLPFESDIGTHRNPHPV